MFCLSHTQTYCLISNVYGYKTRDPSLNVLTQLPFMTTASPRGKKKQTDPHGEDKKKKQHKLGMSIRNVYISV